RGHHVLGRDRDAEAVALHRSVGQNLREAGPELVGVCQADLGAPAAGAHLVLAQDAALLDEQHAVADALHLAEQVRVEQHGGAASGAYPTRRRASRSSGSPPKRRASPASGSSSRSASCMAVVFPAPLGPSSATISPRRTEKLRSSTATICAPPGAR